MEDGMQQKPALVFFGESISNDVKDESYVSIITFHISKIWLTLRTGSITLTHVTASSSSVQHWLPTHHSGQFSTGTELIFPAILKPQIGSSNMHSPSQNLSWWSTLVQRALTLLHLQLLSETTELRRLSYQSGMLSRRPPKTYCEYSSLYV